MFILLVAAAVLVIVPTSTCGFGNAIKKAITINPIEMVVEDFGYPIEQHKIETIDGYQIMLHRVPHGKGQWRRPGHPVLLAHGLLQSSALYLAMKDGLAYLLADAGFDVWLLNSRGNTYSRGHKFLKPTQKEFWDFSFHELGKFDLPAAMDYILQVTQRPTLSYVGFSMGTTMFWVLADSWPQYMAKVDTMVAIAPAARTSNSFIVRKPKLHQAFVYLLSSYEKLNMFEARPFNPMEALIIKALCNTKPTKKVCNKITSNLLGLFHDSIDFQNSFISTQYMPAGTSVKNLKHYLQVSEKAEFKQFDYGKVGNRNHYQRQGTSFPPPFYDLKKVTCPVFFIASEMDTIAVKEDVDWLAKQLPSMPKYLFTDAVKGFDHNDFFFAKDAKSILHEPLVSFMKERIRVVQK